MPSKDRLVVTVDCLADKLGTFEEVSFIFLLYALMTVKINMCFAVNKTKQLSKLLVRCSIASKKLEQSASSRLMTKRTTNVCIIDFGTDQRILRS